MTPLVKFVICTDPTGAIKVSGFNVLSHRFATFIRPVTKVRCIRDESIWRVRNFKTAENHHQ